MNEYGLRIIFMLAFNQPKVARIWEAGWFVAVDKLVFEPNLIGFPNCYVWKPCCNRGRCVVDMFIGDKQLEGKKASRNEMGKRKRIFCPY